MAPRSLLCLSAVASIVVLLSCFSCVDARLVSWYNYQQHHQQQHPIPSVVSNLFATDAALVRDGNSSKLPVFFFHGVTSNAFSGHHYQANLTAEGRVYIALHFCQDRCSIHALNKQVELAIQQIREIIATHPEVFEHGYIIIGHSQGAALSRAVIEEMDDHRVVKYISLAGAQNGIFYGPQPEDLRPLSVFVNGFGATLVPSSVIDFTRYTPENYRGKIQYDLTVKQLEDTELQDDYSCFNLARSPVHDEWVKANVFLPVINNINVCYNEDVVQQKECMAKQQRRKLNFLKLEEAHFFASPHDGIISPWQTSILGQYNDVEFVEEVETKFESFKILDIKQTFEYQQDTYGSRTLDERGGLFLHAVPNVTHSCWVEDRVHANNPCYYQPIYDKYIYPLLQ